MTSEAPAETAEASSSGPDPIIGKVIDGCRIQRKLGQGGMGVVYLAQHETLKQQFVIKILNPALVGAEDTVERFFREAQACAQLNHPGIVAIQNVGQEGEYYFIRMEYIEGKTLEEVVKAENQLEWRRAVSIIMDTAEALSHAHQKGMIHRDIKPENVMLTPDGAVKVMDFGLAKHVHSNAKVSVTGQIVGTPFFMSPEQAGGKPTDARSDIYSLGVTLYYLVTGVKPFNGKNLQEIFLKHFFYAPESPKIYNGELPESLCEVVKKCLKKKKKERYQSAKELARDLKAVLDDPDAIVAKDEAGSGEAAPPSGEAAGADEYGKTIRAKSGEEAGDQTVVAGGRTQEDGDHTVRVGGNTVEKTVRVDEEQGGTIKVGAGAGDDNDPTVAVKARAGRTGQVATVSFQDGKSVVVNTQQLDADHPAAGLDLPTAVLQAGATSTPGVVAPSKAGAARKASQRRLLVVGGLVVGPLVVLAGMELRARGKLEALTARYEEVTAQEVVMKQRPEELLALAGEIEGASGGLATDKARLTGMATRLRDYAETITRRQREEAEAEAERLKKEQAARERKEKAAELERLAGGRQKVLEDLRAARDWAKYTEAALSFVADYQELLPTLTSGVLIPVQVTTTPPGAELYVNQAPTPEAERTPGVAWVPPQRDFKVRIRKRGFEEQVVSGEATAFVEASRELVRHVVREVSLGEVTRTIGTRRVAEPLVPASEPGVDPADGGALYFVGVDGLLHSVGLRDKAQWPALPRAHRVGVYGDPTPAPCLVPGQVILVGSLLGTLSAHRPSNQGQRIWTAEVGAAVTAAPAFAAGRAGQKVACVGTASGDVVFVDTKDGSVLWRFRAENQIVATPLLLGDRAYVGSTDNRLYALDWSRRELLGVVDVGDDVVAGPVALGRLLVVGTRDGVGHVIDATDPAAMRQVAVLGAPGAVMGRDQGIVVAADRVYVAAGRRVQAYTVSAAGKAQEAWAAPFECPGAPVTRPAVGGEVLYVAGLNGVVYALDRATGDLLWKYGVAAGSITSTPFVVDDELFLVAGGKVIALEAE